jgi:hypothetical protein
LAGSDAGSGHIFTGSTGGKASRAKFINNIFEPVNGSYTFQASNNCDWYFAYNTFLQTPGLGCTAITWVGNLGVASAYPDCSGIHIKNMWQGSGSCSSDTFIGNQSLGLDANSRLTSSSPAIDAGETPSASDHCTGADVSSRDIDGTTRPQGAACDAGADEVISTGGGGTTAKTGDLNSDNLVNIFDLSILLSNYGKTKAQATNPACDLNNDSQINIFDLSILLSNYGK